LKPGKDGENISLADWTFFMDLIRRGRVKQAQALLQYRLNVSREQSIKLQQENMRLNGENAQKIEQQKAQNKLAELKAQEQKEIRVEAAKALFTYAVRGVRPPKRFEENNNFRGIGRSTTNPSTCTTTTSIIKRSCTKNTN
jgi:hypothetical protein